MPLRGVRRAHFMLMRICWKFVVLRALFRLLLVALSAGGGGFEEVLDEFKSLLDVVLVSLVLVVVAEACGEASSVFGLFSFIFSV